MYTLDTNAIIYYLKGDSRVSPLLNRLLGQNVALYISSLTEIELFGFSGLTETEEQAINEFLDTIGTIPLDSRVARTAGSLRRRYGLSVTDSAIAATALFTGTILVTRNVRDFKKVPSLKLLAI